MTQRQSPEVWKRSRINTATTAASTRKVMVVWPMAKAASDLGRWGYVCTDEPGPSGIPIRYQATKNSIQAIVRMTT